VPLSIRELARVPPSRGHVVLSRPTPTKIHHPPANNTPFLANHQILDNTLPGGDTMIQYPTAPHGLTAPSAPPAASPRQCPDNQGAQLGSAQPAHLAHLELATSKTRGRSPRRPGRAPALLVDPGAAWRTWRSRRLGGFFPATRRCAPNVARTRVSPPESNKPAKKLCKPGLPARIRLCGLAIGAAQRW
jgi:hypothetical protein